MEKNIYLKIQEAKKTLMEKHLKKSGLNKFANFKYYELSDFLPSIVEIFNDLKLFSLITFDNEKAVLKIINAENIGEMVEYQSPMKDLTLKGSNELQALGGVETYQRRYLYMNALDIVENDTFDVIDSSANKKEVAKEENVLITKAQSKRMFAVSNGNAELCKEAIHKFGYEKSEEVQKKDYDNIISFIENRLKNGATSEEITEDIQIPSDEQLNDIFGEVKNG